MKEVINESKDQKIFWKQWKSCHLWVEWQSRLDMFFHETWMFEISHRICKRSNRLNSPFLVDFCDWLIGYICLLLLLLASYLVVFWLVGWRRPYVWGTVGRLFAISQQPSSHSCTQSVSDRQKGKTPSWMIFFHTFTFILKFSLSLSFTPPFTKKGRNSL